MLSKDLLCVLVLSALTLTATAQNTPSTITIQWSYANNGVTTYYPSKALAVAAMQAAKPQNSLLTVPKPPNTMTGSGTQYPYAAPTPLQPTYGDPTFYLDVGGGGFPSEAAAAAVLAQGPNFAQCGVGTAVPTGPWSSQFFSNGYAVEDRPYDEYWYGWDYYSTPQCGSAPVLSANYGLYLQRTYSCPQYYSYSYYSDNGSYTADQVACTDSNSDYVVGTPIPCPQSAAPGTSTQVGDPCDAMSGEFSQTETDYAGPALSLTRYYHSATSLASSGIGAGWTHNFAAYLIVPFGGSPGLIRPDGHQDPVFYIPGTGYETTSGDGIHLVSSSGQWIAYLPDGSQEIYNSSGVLIELISAGGAITTLNYTAGLLTSVVGPFGQTLIFAYNTNNNISTVTDPAGNTISYSYDSFDNLASVEYQDGSTRTYQYTNTAFPNHLTGILDESSNQFLSVTYDSYGRASSSQNAGGANFVSLAFNSTSATVVDGLGGQTVFGFVANSQSTPRVTSVSHNGLTDSLEIAQQTYANYEVARARPAVSMLPTLAQLFGISVDELLGLKNGTGKRGPTPLLQKQIERLNRLPRAQQKVVMQMLDGVLSQASR